MKKLIAVNKIHSNFRDKRIIKLTSRQVVHIIDIRKKLMFMFSRLHNVRETAEWLHFGREYALLKPNLLKALTVCFADLAFYNKGWNCGGKKGLLMLEPFYVAIGETASVLCGVSLILFAGFLVTRLTNRLGLPKVSGYILAGVLIGPDVLHLVPDLLEGHMDFLSDIALAFIAFSAGKFFKRKVLEQAGIGIIWITVCESLTAGVLVMLVMRFMFGLDFHFALLLGAIATATAPASTMMTIQQYHAKGEFVNTLLQVVALDDAVCLLAYSLAVTVVKAGQNGQVKVMDLLLPVVYNLLSLLLGFVCGMVLGKLITPARSKDNRLILVLAMLFGISGICTCFDVSPLLSCMVFGATYINATSDKKLYRQIQNFTPPVMSLFFIVSGMSLDLGSIRTAGVIGVVYFFVRIAGKYLGSYVSCRMTGKNREVCRYLGFALIPQAGVAIGLAFMGERQLPPEMGKLLLTIILSSSVLYELVGPAAAKKGLQLAGVIPGGHLETVRQDKQKQHFEKNKVLSSKFAARDQAEKKETEKTENPIQKEMQDKLYTKQQTKKSGRRKPKQK